MANITPLEIRKQTFRTSFRGADVAEVRAFLDLLAAEQEKLIETSTQLADRLRNAEDRLAEYRSLDDTLRSSVLTAERHAQEARETSQREANLILQEADWRAKQMLEDARERLNRLNDEIRDLAARKDAYIQHLRSFLQAQAELLDSNDQYLSGIDRLSEQGAAMASRIRRPETRPAAPPPPPRPGAQRPAAPAPAAPFPPQQDPREGDYPPGGFDAPQGFAASGFEMERPPSRPAPPPRLDERAERDPRHQPPPSYRPPAERDEGLFEISAEEEDDPRR